MKMKNLFAGLVATSMVVSMGTSAMAATYNDKNGTVAIGADLTAYAGEQVTVLIVEADKDGLTPTEIGNEMILYIDQTEAAAGIFQDMGVKGGALEAGKTYIVRIGGEKLSEDGIIEEKLTIGDNAWMFGDVTNDSKVTLKDANEIVKHKSGMASVFDDEATYDLAFKAGDVTGDDKLTLKDANEIVKYKSGMPSVFDK